MKLYKLLLDENTKIVRLKTDNGDIIYIEEAKEHISSELINSFEDIASELNVPIVLSYNGYEFLLLPGEKINALRMMERQNINYLYYKDILVNDEIEKILSNATIENIARKLKKIKELQKVTRFYPGLHPEPMVTISEKIYELYKFKEPDDYLDSMVEKAKILIKGKSN